MSNLSISDKKKRHARQVLRYMKKCTKAYQFIRELNKELNKRKLFLNIPLELTLKYDDVLRKCWFIGSWHYNDNLEILKMKPPKLITTKQFIKDIEKVAKAQGFKRVRIKDAEPVKIVKITPSGEEDEIINVQP